MLFGGKCASSSWNNLSNFFSLQKTSEAVDDQKYSDAAGALYQLETLFQQPLTANDDKISILANMQVELMVSFYYLSWPN